MEGEKIMKTANCDDFLAERGGSVEKEVYTDIIQCIHDLHSTILYFSP
jgi:hypothetical protein